MKTKIILSLVTFALDILSKHIEDIRKKKSMDVPTYNDLLNLDCSVGKAQYFVHKLKTNGITCNVESKEKE